MLSGKTRSCELKNPMGEPKVFKIEAQMVYEDRYPGDQIEVVEKSEYDSLVEEMKACIKSHDEAVDAARAFQRMIPPKLMEINRLEGRLQQAQQFLRMCADLLKKMPNYTVFAKQIEGVIAGDEIENYGN